MIFLFRLLALGAARRAQVACTAMALSLLHIFGVTSGGLSVGGISSANCPGAISGHKFMEKQKDSVKIFYIKDAFLRKFPLKNHKTPLKNPKTPVRKTRKRLCQDTGLSSAHKLSQAFRLICLIESIIPNQSQRMMAILNFFRHWDIRILKTLALLISFFKYFYNYADSTSKCNC